MNTSSEGSNMNRYFSLFRVFIFVAILTRATTPIPAATITVDDDQPADYSAIQPAIQAAVNGDTVVVRDGTYTGTQNRNLDFAGKAITVRSENGPANCIIDCQSAARAFYFHSGETVAARLEGLTIRNGKDAEHGGGIHCVNASPTIVGCVFDGNAALQYGGGIYIQSGNPLLERCRFATNTAAHGGGMFLLTASPKVTDCIFTGNSVSFNGGGIHVWTGSNPTLQRCRFLDNTAGQYGGGILLSEANGTFLDCEISENLGNQGGGITVYGNAQPSFSRCTVRGNMATYGGGFYTALSGAKPTISSCLVVVNYAGLQGGGLYSTSAYPNLVNCTIAGNVADSLGGGFYSIQYAPTISNSILWGNTPTANVGPATIIYSDVQDGYAGTGNRNEDPQFANALYGDYHLLAASTCLNVGNNAATAIPAQDRDGKTRILGVVDLGAYESGPRMLLVPHQYSTIEAAMQAAVNGDTVLVDDGVYYDRLNFTNKTITVRSIHGPKRCIVNSNGLWDSIVYFSSSNKASTVLQGFTFQGKQIWAAYNGGAIYCGTDSSPTILDCIVRDNINSRGSAGINCFYASPTIVNCTVSRNIGYNGAGIMCWISSPAIINCTIADNVAYTDGGVAGAIGAGIASVYGAPVVTNCILWGNSTKQIHVVGTPVPAVSYSNIQGGYSGAGNINVDPQFLDPDGGDYRLMESSGCLNRGNNAANTLPLDQFGQLRQQYGQIDLGAYEFSKVLRVPQDYSEIQPAIDAAATGDTILVADGQYPGNLNFKGKAITIRSELGPAFCILHAGGAGRGVVFETAETADAILEGFTITGGFVEGSGGGIVCDSWARPTIRNCILRNNQAQYGGAIACLRYASPLMVNCLIAENSATQVGGGAFCDSSSLISLTHCTIVNNSASAEESGGGMYWVSGGRGIVANSILRGNVPEQFRNEGSVYNVSLSFSNIEGGCATCMGYGNMDADALFIDPSVDDYHLRVDSPCIGTGRADGHGLPLTDLEGRNRYADNGTDIGAYEYGHDTWNVPSQIATIQEAIDKACYGDTIIVDPGTYPGGIDFKGKAITLQAKPGVEECVIDCGGAGPGVAFGRGERSTSVLSGFTILNANGADGGAIFCMNASPTIVNCLLRNNAAQRGAGVFSIDASPAITNCTIVANTASVIGGGIYSSGSPSPIATNCILWANASDQIAFEGDAPAVTYCDVQGGFSGAGNLNADPRFIDAGGGNYRLVSTATYDRDNRTWQWFLTPASPCVDKGNNGVPGLPTIDKVGTVRICRAAVDLGAYEMSGLAVLVTGPKDDWQLLRYLPDKVQSGDVVTLPDGTYFLSGPINFKGKAFTLRSISGPEKCILQGQTYSQGFHFKNGEGPQSVLSGLTIRGCVHNQGTGGGIWCVGASPTIVNCHITDNNPWMASDSGGGIHLESGSNPLISDCVVSRNQRTGIYCDNSTPTIVNCMISGNTASGIMVKGNVNPMVVNCLIVGNSKGGNGGGGITVGTGYPNPSSITCINCTITGNSGGDGGGIGCWDGQWLLVNTLIWGNSGWYKADEFHWSGGPYDFYGCQIGGADPKFRNPAGGDYRLLEGSPCFNAGIQELAWWMDPLVLPETDLAGNPRILYGTVDVGAFELEYRPVVSGGLKIDITPAQAAQEGAQWQLGDGVWHNPTDTVSGLTAGYYTVSFKSLPGWIDPAPLSVWVSGDLLATAAADYQSTHFAIGQIPAMEIRQGKELDFQVCAEGLSGTVIYSYQIQGSPQGALSLNPANGRFVYTPSAPDKDPFSITLIATNGQQTVFQTMEITPIVDLPGEYDLFDEPTQPLPDPQSDDYILKEVFNNPAELFNNVSRTTRTINILGKDVVIRSGNPNNLYLYDNNEDIKAMTIYADTLIVRSPFRLPQTSVTIYARQLRFEGTTACIDTTPRSLSVAASGTGAAGVHGIQAGSMTLYVESVYSEGNRPNRLILQGGNGQAPGPGTHGADGQSFTPLTSCAQPILWPNMMYISWDGNYCKAAGYSNAAHPNPMSGKDAVAAGKPGNGGAGGDVHSNLDLRTLVSNPGGSAQPSTPALLHAQYDRKGGIPGNPYPAFEAYWRNFDPHWYIQQVSYPGNDAPAPEPDLWVGNTGQFHRVGHSLSWLHPQALKMVVGYAKDAYLNKYYQQAQAVFESYLTPLNQYIGSSMWSSVPAQQQQELEQLRDEILTYLHQLECGLDFFGNPPGWAPMLSFEVTQQVYEREVDRALQVLYLSYWLGTVMGNAAQESAGLETARNTLKQQIDDFKAQYTAAVNLIPMLKTESEEIAAGVDSLQQQLKEKEQELLAQAEQNVRDRHKVPWWKTALRVMGSLATTVPRAPNVGAGILMGAGSILDTLSEEFLSDAGWDGIINQTDIAKQFTTIDFNEAVNNWMTDGGVTIAGKNEAELQGYLDNLKTSAAEIASNMTAIKDTLKESHINNEEVGAELDKIKQANPEFNRLVDQTVELMARKELFAQQLASTMQKVSGLSNEIRHNLISVDALNRRVGEVAVVLDQRAKLYMKEMDRRARSRLLKYHYYLSKAYEYRLLEPYPDSLNLLPIFDRFKTIFSANGQLSSSDFQALRPLLTDQLSTIADRIYTQFINNRPGGGELATSFTFDLTADEIQRLNSYGMVPINLYERGLFLPSEEDIRIVNLSVESLTPQNPQSGCGVSYIKVYLEHSGVSRLMKNGKTYLFRHYRKNSSEDPSINKSVWGSTFDHNNGNLIDPIAPSAASESLLRSVLGITDDKLMLYSRPAAWSDLVVRIEKNPGLCDDILIGTLKLRIRYDYSTRSSSQVVLSIDSSRADLLPYYVLDTADLNGRQDGVGEFNRIYTKSTYGDKKVSIVAPRTVGGWRFQKWTRRNGSDLPSGFYTSDPTRIHVPLDASYSVRTQYQYVGGLVRYGDGDADQDVDLADLGIISAQWMRQVGPGCGECDKVDFNNDGRIDLDDLMIFVFHWLQ